MPISSVMLVHDWLKMWRHFIKYNSDWPSQFCCESAEWLHFQCFQIFLWKNYNFESWNCPEVWRFWKIFLYEEYFVFGNTVQEGHALLQEIFIISTFRVAYVRHHLSNQFFIWGELSSRKTSFSSFRSWIEAKNIWSEFSSSYRTA